MDPLLPVIATVLGLIAGSFLTVVVDRVPRGERMVPYRSRCPSCGARIRSRDNIPVLSWVLLRGRCRSCGDRISLVYPLIELATAGLFVGAALAFEDPVVAVLIGPFLGLMLAIAVIDARKRVVPNVIVYPALVVYLIALVTIQLAGGEASAVRGLLGVAAYAGPLLLVALVVPGGMGMGDVKLAALIGLVLGSIGLAYVGVAAGVGILAGGLGAIIAMVFLKFRRHQQMPFGPFLAAGAIVAAFAGPAITDRYLSLLGM